MFVPNFKILGAVVPEKSLTKLQKWTNKGNDKHKDSDSYTIQVVVPNVCIKFQNPRCSSS